MTDITDQEKRVLREWADDNRLRDEETDLAARYILATVDAPAPALSEELARIAEHSAVWTIQNVCDELKSAAAHAEQVEKERDEARAEVKRLTAERLYRNPKTNARAEAALNNLDNAERVAVATVAPEENVTPDQQANAQGILAGSLPDPADVKPGEAWIVECRGERRNAVKDRDDNNEPWNTIDSNGQYVYKRNENVTLVSRLVPAPRVITNPDELDALAEGSVVQTRNGDLWKNDSDGMWTYLRPEDAITQRLGPVTVLWEPGE